MNSEREAASAGSTAPPRSTYAAPPVHEVVLDLKFREALDDEGLETIPDVLGTALDQSVPGRLSSFEVQAGVGSPAPNFRAGSRFSGWEYVREEPLWVLRAQHGQLTMHFARSEDWPKGPYVGWERILEQFLDIVARLREVYGGLGVRRAGLRYLNRIAVPLGSATEEWFTLALPDPPSVEGLYSFAVEETWEKVVGFDGLSAKIRLAKIRIPHEELAEDQFGVLLDIDVFNLFVGEAPPYDDLAGWFEQAHEAENRVFESCITDALRQRFDAMEDE